MDTRTHCRSILARSTWGTKRSESDPVCAGDRVRWFMRNPLLFQSCGQTGLPLTHQKKMPVGCRRLPTTMCERNVEGGFSLLSRCTRDDSAGGKHGRHSNISIGLIYTLILKKNHNRFETKKSVGNNGGQKKARHGKRRYDGPFFQVKTSRSQDPRCRIHRFRW